MFFTIRQQYTDAQEVAATAIGQMLNHNSRFRDKRIADKGEMTQSETAIYSGAIDRISKLTVFADTADTYVQQLEMYVSELIADKSKLISEIRQLREQAGEAPIRDFRDDFEKESTRYQIIARAKEKWADHFDSTHQPNAAQQIQINEATQLKSA